MLTREDLLQIKNIFHSELENGLKPIKKDVNKIKKDQNVIIKFANEGLLELRTRVEKLEKFLHLPSN